MNGPHYPSYVWELNLLDHRLIFQADFMVFNLDTVTTFVKDRGTFKLLFGILRNCRIGFLLMLASFFCFCICYFEIEVM